MLVHVGLEFDSVDRCFAKMAAAGFAGLIAVVLWMWPAIHTSAGFSHQRASLTESECRGLLSQSVAAFAEKNHIFEKTHLFSMRRG